MFGLKALQKKPRKQIREAAAMGAQRLLSLSKQERAMQLRALLGPKGGLPRLKEELQKAAALLNTPLSPTATVDEIRKLLQPIVKDLIAKPNWEAPDVLRSSQVVVKAKAKPSAAPATTAQPQVINLASQDADEGSSTTSRSTRRACEKADLWAIPSGIRSRSRRRCQRRHSSICKWIRKFGTRPSELFRWR